MERLFGRDLSDVRVVDSALPVLIGAHAFAYGPLIFAPRAEDLFETEAGWWLLGHELTHVLQQRDGRASIANASALPILEDSRLEAEADGMGRAAARAFASGHVSAPCYAAPSWPTAGPVQPVIQCVMSVEEFRQATQASGIRSLDRISAIDNELKTYQALNERKPKRYSDMHKAARKLYEAAKAFKSQKPDSSRMPGVDRLIKEIVIEDAILSKLAEYEAAKTDLEKFVIIETIQENFFKQRDRRELNNKTLDDEIYALLTSTINSAANQAAEFVKRDIQELIKIGNESDTPGLLKSVIAECTAARNIQQLDAASGKPGLKYNRTRGATSKYALNHAMEQSLGKRFRMGSLLHELTHLSIAEIFDNTCIMLAIRADATDAEILEMAKSRNAKIHQLIAKIDENVGQFNELTSMTMTSYKGTPQEVTRNRLHAEYKEKALYPVNGKFSQYLAAFQKLMDPAVHARLSNLRGQGLDCELIEYDTVVNQMLLWSHLYGMDTNCSVYTTLDGLVREAHAYRLRSRALKSRPPAKPLPVPPGLKKTVVPVAGPGGSMGKPLPPIPAARSH
jgi:hypothetical protein